MKPRKTEVMRTRCTQAWKYELEVFAHARGVEMSDVVRIACDVYMGKPTMVPVSSPVNHGS